MHLHMLLDSFSIVWFVVEVLVLLMFFTWKLILSKLIGSRNRLPPSLEDLKFKYNWIWDVFLFCLRHRACCLIDHGSNQVERKFWRQVNILQGCYPRIGSNIAKCISWGSLLYCWHCYCDIHCIFFKKKSELNCMNAF